MPLCHIALAVEGAGWNNPDNIPLMIANTIVGAWDRSQGQGTNLPSTMMANVAQSGIAHSYQSFNTCYTDTGLW